MRFFRHIPLLVLCACTYPTSERETLTQHFQLQETIPTAGEREVPLRRPIDLFFNLPPDPDSVTSVHVRIFAGLIEAKGETHVDLLRRRIRFVPARPLRPLLRYQVYLHRDLRGLGGGTLEEAIVFNFTTGTAERWPASEPEVVTATDIQPLWSRSCLPCHGSAAPPSGVDLSSPVAARSSLRAAPSSFGDKPRVYPGDHSRSYLMLKLLGSGAFVGFPMPADGDILPPQDLRLIATWIDGGAP